MKAPEACRTAMPMVAEVGEVSIVSAASVQIGACGRRSYGQGGVPSAKSEAGWCGTHAGLAVNVWEVGRGSPGAACSLSEYREGVGGGEESFEPVGCDRDAVRLYP